MPDPAGNPLDPSRIEAQVAPADEAALAAANRIGVMAADAYVAGKIGPLFALVAEWYRKNIDSDAFKAGGGLGPPAP